MLVCSHQCLPGGGDGGALLRMGIARARVCHQLHETHVLVTHCGLNGYVHRQLEPSLNLQETSRNLHRRLSSS